MMEELRNVLNVKFKINVKRNGDSISGEMSDG